MLEWLYEMLYLFFIIDDVVKVFFLLEVIGGEMFREDLYR